MALLHQSLTRAAARQTLRLRPSTQRLMQPKYTQRNYATNESPSQEKSGSQRGLLIAMALAVPAAYYMMNNRGDAKKAVGDIQGEHHGANQEYKKGAEGNN